MKEETLRELQNVLERARKRGDETAAVILEGVLMYASLGRELDLVEAMHHFELELRPAVEGTPSAEELHRLYEG